ncbi:DNA/RNA non-specific endonuclease, partial [Streptomyces sp. NPDC056785]|uniref:DNA/RNA non-specific endonuclease n=1 Tax=Streptomyces sp. NPDC056785 TaxID=3345944 RepID=UPI00369C2248
GAVMGAAGGALGALGGKLLAKVAPKAMKVVGGLFGKGATEAGDSAAADATEEAASAAESEGAGTRSQSESGGSCKIPKAPRPHSFTGSTPVLMGDGTTKAIDQVQVGDTITNSVPGVAGTQVHKVTAVIVTRTDHDFVDLTVRKTAGSAAKQVAKAGTKPSLARKVARKAAFGLAASAAVLGALAATHGHHGQEPATAPVAVVSGAASGQDSKAAGATGAAHASDDAKGAHLTTTFHHPFYDETQSAFVEAKDLHKGDVLQTPTGTAEVTGVRLFHAHTTTYDLTIGTLHTYYVEAGDTPVLVHNCNTSYSEIENGQRGPAYAEVTPQVLDDAAANKIGSTPGRSAKDTPDGFVRNSDDSRGHLIGKQFGGDGHDMRNIITQGKVQNNGDISDVENSIADHVRATGNTVLMSVTPFYRNGGVRASHVLIEAVDDHGWSISHLLPNF